MSAGLRAIIGRHARLCCHESGMPALYLLEPDIHLTKTSLEGIDPMKEVGIDPFWGFVWPGSYAIHRYLLDNPALPHKCVVDFGSGCGLSAITAKQQGARHVVANDICEMAISAIQMNAEKNNVEVKLSSSNLIGREMDGTHLVLCGGES